MGLADAESWLALYHCSFSQTLGINNQFLAFLKYSGSTATAHRPTYRRAFQIIKYGLYVLHYLEGSDANALPQVLADESLTAFHRFGIFLR